MMEIELLTLKEEVNVNHHKPKFILMNIRDLYNIVLKKSKFANISIAQLT